MSDEITLEGKQFFSAKRASEMSGYARDYIGQLARKGLISAQRVGGLWYVSLESLQAYQQNAAAFTPVAPRKQAQDIEAVISFDGKDYISASRGAKLTGYNQDYIGQLARAGKMLSRQIGNRWYVEREGLLAHKAHKDALLGAVQAESVGLLRPEARQEPSDSSKMPLGASSDPLLSYFQEDKDLMPVLKNTADMGLSGKAETHSIPIHVVREPKRPSVAVRRSARLRPAPRMYGKKAMVMAAEAGVALTFVVVLSYGLVTLKDGSLYTFNAPVHGENSSQEGERFTASAINALSALTGKLEELIAPEVVYRRAP